jgi:hypothetical protein
VSALQAATQGGLVDVEAEHQGVLVLTGFHLCRPSASDHVSVDEARLEPHERTAEAVGTVACGADGVLQRHSVSQGRAEGQVEVAKRPRATHDPEPAPVAMSSPDDAIAEPLLHGRPRRALQNVTTQCDDALVPALGDPRRGHGRDLRY